MSKSYYNAGVDKLISAIISNAISTYLCYQSEIVKVENKLKTFDYKGKIRYRYQKDKDRTIIYYTHSSKEKDNDRLKIEKMKGECDYILRWFVSKDFERLAGTDYNGQYFVDILTHCDQDTWTTMKRRYKRLEEQEIDIEESLKDD